MASRTVKKEREKRYTAEEATRLVLEEIDIGDDGKNQCLDEGEGEEKDEDLSLNVFNSTEIDEALSLISNVNEIFNMPHPNYDERYRVPHKEVSTLNFSTLSSDDNQSSGDENK